MIVFLTAVSTVALVNFFRVLARDEMFKAGMFLVTAVICGLWATELHVPGMRDFIPGPLVALGTLLFCISLERHEKPVARWVLGPLGQILGGGLAIAGLILAQICVAW
ncbi:MAG TPA: hypothetical protein DEB30_00815 [Candidatus Peribacter riflensis]|uniref:Uncharacterized protein n=1 Tax=Candidatus Peribacter riflensis TaxID=1735162 RepID=A0A0S1SLY2_9BACT|nr:MAG: hypothetical protein PeribacterA2_0261 [Candidatus Peribacter riflensis]OGJ78232.1 MAG: hypothetical protein A2398_05060 [Candidatus Peribacteria bacterium RIFOXYB1_FULL_57_12]OGJ82983.1 MAG: hypothetical protein A2412_05180 [Candidatus Peribacteria bacterium RIFOXYC1_FULL_58_8]ALM10755.1 MAG: hypothetical protein PeribacterB2_0261 [Candidatus Peribacter riflensis]ALM11857.1 MAG: hypothetical protein PeribacterC2_0260 [Candidatus Peribacter riflensis]